MATTGKLEGTLFLFYADGVAISESTSGSIEFSADTRDTTTKDNGAFRTIVPTVLSGTGSCDGLVALDATYGIEDMFTAWAARTSMALTFSTDVADDIFYSATAYITSISVEAPYKDNTTYSVSFELTGTISQLTNI